MPTVTVGGLWMTYIITVVVVLIILWLLRKVAGWPFSVGLFIASIIAALVTFGTHQAALRNNLTNSDKSSLSNLYLVALGLPVASLVWVFVEIYANFNRLYRAKGKDVGWGWGKKKHDKKGYSKMNDDNDNDVFDDDDCEFESEYECNARTGQCAPVKDKVKCDNNKATVRYVL